MNFYSIKIFLGFAGRKWVNQQIRLVEEDAQRKIYIADVKLSNRETVALLVEGIPVACLSDKNSIHNLIKHMDNIREHYTVKRLSDLGVYDEMQRLGILEQYINLKEGNKNGK